MVSFPRESDSTVYLSFDDDFWVASNGDGDADASDGFAFDFVS